MKKIVILLSVLILLTACAADKPALLPPAELFGRLAETGLFEPPYMLDIQESRLSEYHVNPDDAVSFVVKEAAISAIFIQLIIIEAQDGRAAAVYNAMREHQANLLDDAFYPQGREAAAASVVGRRGNLVYLICDERAEEIERELLKYESENN
jgi:hypothetical protein